MTSQILLMQNNSVMLAHPIATLIGAILALIILLFIRK